MNTKAYRQPSGQNSTEIKKDRNLDFHRLNVKTFLYLIKLIAFLQGSEVNSGFALMFNLCPTALL